MQGKRRRLLSFVLALILLQVLLPGGVLAATVVASGECGADGGNLSWTLDSDGVLTISGTGEMADYYLEAPWWHYGDIVRIEIGNGVTSIGESAFSDCISLTSVTIPGSVTSIGDFAFYSCRELTSVSIPSSVTSIGDSAFDGCSGLTSVTIPEGVTSIGRAAFISCRALTSVTIPSSVTSIGGITFADCRSLTAIEVATGNPQFGSANGILYNKDKTELIVCPAGKQGTVTIPSSVTSIEGSAFYGCSGLTTIEVAAGNSQFSSANGILYNKDKTELIVCPAGKQGAVTIPSSVTSIVDSAFDGCSGLTSVTIPNSVTSIGSGAFRSCSGLTSVSIPSSVRSIDSYTFDSCSGLTSVTIPEGVTSIGRAAFWDCSSLTSITIPNSLTSIGESAFYGCDELTSVTIPASVTSLGDGAFSGCSGLTAIKVAAGNSQFSSANGILYNKDKTELIACPAGKQGTVTIPEGVTSIRELAFDGCISLTSVTIPSGVTSIGELAFGGCISLTNVSIPSTVTSIVDGAFYDCISLSTVYYGGTQEEWNHILIGEYGNDALTNADIQFNSGPLSITTQPKNYVGAVGSTATATVVATGEGLTYQWYFANPGATSFTKSGSKTATYSATLTAANSGRRMYCVIKDAYGNSVQTNTVTMTAVADPVSITTQPKNYVGAVGSTATATVKATGEGLTYQWYFANPGATSFTKSGSKTATYSATLTAANSGRRMYCVITDASGNSVTTNTVTMTASLSITTQPTNYVGAVGSTATATVKATGEGLSYQWYFANPGATSFTKSGSKTATYSATLTAANSGRRMYCVIKDAYGNSVQTNTVTMTAVADPVSITTQPKNYVGAVGSTATATVKATGEGLTYQWYFANPGATSFTKSGSKTATYSATLTAANSGRRMYCVITDASGNTVTTNTVTMTASLSITTQPKNYVGAVGSTATATVKATGEGLSYQWYFANPGATSFTKSGSKTATYSATLTAANSGRRMYCVITDASGNSVTTNTVTMKVG